MTDRKWWLTGLLVLCFGLSPLWAQEGEATDTPRRVRRRDRTGRPGEVGREADARGRMRRQRIQLDIAKVLDLNDAQKAKLEEKAKALAEWQVKFKEVREASSEARKTRDKEALAKAGKQRRQLHRERMKLIAKYDAELMATLTDEQKIKWEGAKLYSVAMRGFSRAELTEQQKQTITQMCNAKAKELVSLQDKNAKEIAGLKDPKAVENAKRQARMAKAKFRDAVSEGIYKNVLTEEQRKKLDRPRRGATQPGRRGRRPGAPVGSGKE